MCPLKVLFLYSSVPTASNVFDHAEAFKKHSQHNVFYSNVIENIPTFGNLENFDVVIIHHSIFILSDFLCPPLLRAALRRSSAIKVLFMQDEYRCVNQVRELIRFMEIDLFYTTVPQKHIEEIYPSEWFPSLKKIHTLPAFVPEDLLEEEYRSYEQRDLDVVYRAQKLPYWLGKLGQEKWEIAERFLRSAEKYHLKMNISTRLQDRVYGDAWIEFLRNSKAVIGCEGGASLYDFTGAIQKNVEQYQLLNPSASFEEVEKIFFPNLDRKICYNMLSPRGFECAALGTLMILYEAKYSGVLVPWRHYVPLKKDHSNMEEILPYIRNPSLWRMITTQAYEEIACNSLYSYQYFIASFDKEIYDFYSKRSRKRVCFDCEEQESEPSRDVKRSFMIASNALSVSAVRRQSVKKVLNFLPYHEVIIEYLTKVKAFLCYNSNLLKEVNAYREKHIKIFGYDALHVSQKKQFFLNVVLDPSHKKQVNELSALKKKKWLHLKCEDSWELPENIRGKKIKFVSKKKLFPEK